MGRQINFHMDENMEQALMEEVLKSGWVVCDSESPNTKPTTITTTSKLSQCGDGLQLYFYRPEFGDLAMRTLPDGRIYIDQISSPVIEFFRTRVTHDIKFVSEGRLWVEMKYWDDEEKLVEKPEELAKWYGSLARWVKKNLEKVDMPRVSGNYWTPSIRDLAKQGYRLM